MAIQTEHAPGSWAIFLSKDLPELLETCRTLYNVLAEINNVLVEGGHLAPAPDTKAQIQDALAQARKAMLAAAPNYPPPASCTATAETQLPGEPRSTVVPRCTPHGVRTNGR